MPCIGKASRMRLSPSIGSPTLSESKLGMGRSGDGDLLDSSTIDWIGLVEFIFRSGSRESRDGDRDPEYLEWTEWRDEAR